MRFVLATLLALIMLGGYAFAATAYDDVPRDHWAYNALDYLTERGVLEGYPDGFFKGDRTLTRYEFAQAIARLLDSVGTGADGDSIRVMAETLRAEFSDQLAQLSTTVGMMNDTVVNMDARVGDLEGGVADNAAKIASLEDAVAGFKPGPNWKGVFRYRWEFIDQDRVADYNRFRQRIMFTLGYNKKLNDAVMFGFRLKTQTGADPTSGNHTLGNYGRTAHIYLDRAYVKYTPGWFGFYTKCVPGECGGCPTCTDCNPKLEIYAGIFPNIFHDPYGMILDTDVNLQGMGIIYHFNEDFQIATAASVAVEYAGDDYFGDDTYFFATELEHTNLFTDGLDAWVGVYGWKNENLMNVYTKNAMYNFDFNNDGFIDSSDRFTPNFHTLKGGLQYTFPVLFDKPFKVFGEYMINLESDAEDRIDIVNPFVDPDIIYETTDDTGFIVGAQYGATPKYCRDWYLFANYREIGANAVIGGFADADAGGANLNSMRVGWGYMWANNSLVGITFFLNRMNNAFGFLIPDAWADATKVQIDWTFKF